jgi:hypothetical protein
MGSAVLQVAIGAVFLFVTLSLIVSTLTEGVSRLLHFRAKFLRKSIERLLRNHSSKLDDVMQHALVTPDKHRKPDLVHARGFARALLSVVGVQDLQSGQLGAVVGNVAADTEKNIAEWFDASMEQVSRWYAEYIQWFTRIFAVVVVLVLNADTAMFVERLWNDSALREVVVAQAEKKVEMLADEPVDGRDENDDDEAPSGEPADPAAHAEEIKNLIREELEPFPIGWDLDQLPEGCGEWFKKIIGLLITIIATSLGAPFWFRVLKRMVNLRGSSEPKDPTSMPRSTPPPPAPPTRSPTPAVTPSPGTTPSTTPGTTPGPTDADGGGA